MSEVLQSLEIDQSFFVQFAIVLFIFFTLKTFLFDKLLEVITTREEKTTGLLNKSKEKQDVAKELSEKIELELSSTKTELSNEIKSVKNQLILQKEKEYSDLEAKLESEYATKLGDYKKELSSNFESLKNQTDNLASDLVNKITQ